MRTYNIEEKNDMMSIKSDNKNSGNTEIPVTETNLSVDESGIGSETMGQEDLVKQITQDLQQFEQMEKQVSEANNKAQLNVFKERKNESQLFDSNKMISIIYNSSLEGIDRLNSDIRKEIDNDYKKLQSLHDISVIVTGKLYNTGDDKKRPETLRKLLKFLENFLNISVEYVDKNKMIGENLSGMTFNILYLYNSIIGKLSQMSSTDSQLQELYNKFRSKVSENIELFKSVVTNRQSDGTVSTADMENMSQLAKQLQDKITILEQSNKKYVELKQKYDQDLNNLRNYVSNDIKQIVPEK